MHINKPTTWKKSVKQRKTLSNTYDLTHIHIAPAYELCVHRHLDIYAVHMLIDKSKNLCGIIDWGDVHIGNPAIDLNILFSFLPPAGRTMFLQTYGPISKQTEQLALFRAIVTTSWVVLFAHDTKNKDLLEEALTGLELITQAT